MKTGLWILGLLVFFSISAVGFAALPKSSGNESGISSEASLNLSVSNLHQPDVHIGKTAADHKRTLVQQAFDRLPLYFIENQGQIDSEKVFYYVMGMDKTLYFTKEGISFSLRGQDQLWTVKLDFVGANPDVVPHGYNKQDALFSYFKGKPEDWKAGCASYSKVVYEDLWTSIDLVYSGTANELKYEFVVEPGANPSRIRLAYRGASDVTLDENGELVIKTPAEEFKDARPFAFQEIDGERTEVEIAYVIRKDAESKSLVYGFDIEEYDISVPLVLDPAILVYCGYIGGTEDDWSCDIAVDDTGAMYVTGDAWSGESRFPVIVGPDLIHV